VFVALPLSTFLGYLESDSRDMVIGWIVDLSEFYKFVKRLIFKFGSEI
jgi:hypothetical protein